MKKIMYAAFAAVIALASCNKEPVATEPAQEQGEMKAVTIDLSNVETLAKSTSTAGDLKGQKAVISNFQVFFTNTAGDKFFKGKNANGTDAAHYFARTADLETFHFLSADVTKVIVVANLGAEQSPANVAALKAIVANVADQQEPKLNQLAMIGETEDLQYTGNHTDTHPQTRVFKASVSVKPIIARLEVNTFGVSFAKNSLFKSVTFDKIAFDNYYPQADLSGAVIGSIARQEFVNLNNAAELKAAQKTYFDARLGTEWYADILDANNTQDGTQPIIIARDAAAGTADSPAQVKTQTLEGHRYAYHFFPSAAATAYNNDGYPRLYLQVTSTNNQGETAVQYVMTKNLKAAEFNYFEAGNIYRVNCTFPDSLLEDPLICADVTIDVVAWHVVELTPEW